MKLLMQGTTTVAANGTVNNVLAGEKYERPPGNAKGTLYLTGSATGLEAAINVGGVAVSDTVTVNAQNRTPQVPDDLLIDDWDAIINSLIQLTLFNTTAGALTAQWKIVLNDRPFG